MNEEHHVGILLNGSRLAKVAQLRPLAVDALTVFHRSVELAQCQNRDVEFLGQSLERAGDGGHLLLAVTETHTAGVHQLQIVYHDDFHPFFPHQSAGLRPQLKHRETRRVVHIDGCSRELSQVFVEALPLVRFELTAEYLVSRNLAHVGNQAVHQLHVVHFEREEGDGFAVVHGDVLGDAQRERGLTHGRSAGDDHKVGSLPPARDVVQPGESARHTGQSPLVLGRSHKYSLRFGYHGVYLRVVLPHVLLREFEERTLGVLHQFLHIHRLVVGIGLYLAGKMDELTGEKFLRQYLRMIFHMGRRGHMLTDVEHVGRTAHTLEGALSLEFLDDGHDVHRPLLHVHGLDGFVYLLVAGIIKRLRAQYLRHHGKGILVHHECSEHQLFDVGGLWGQMSVGVVYRGLCTPAPRLV